MFRWWQRMDAEDAIALVATFPVVATRPAYVRERVLQAIGDAIEAEGGVVDDLRVTMLYEVTRTE